MSGRSRIVVAIAIIFCGALFLSPNVSAHTLSGTCPSDRTLVACPSGYTAGYLYLPLGTLTCSIHPGAVSRTDIRYHDTTSHHNNLGGYCYKGPVGARPEDSGVSLPRGSTRLSSDSACRQVACTLLPAPTVDLKVNNSNGPLTIASGTAATISWTSTNATTCTASEKDAAGQTLTGFTGTKAISGSESVTPSTATKTYSITCTNGGRSTTDTVRVTVTAPNRAPIAVAHIGTNGPAGARGTSITVIRGSTPSISLFADNSSDPDGWTTPTLGVSNGGKCEWNADLNSGTRTFERTSSNPRSPTACNGTPVRVTFNDPPGTYTYDVLRITDASGAVSNTASVTVIIQDNNKPPIAVARLKAGTGTSSAAITVNRGVPTAITIDASGSYDPDGWAHPTNGVLGGGKCEINTALLKGPFIAGATITNPASDSACTQNLGNLTFNDAPGTYTYQLLRITDKAGAVSAIISARISVIDSSPNRPPVALPKLSINGAPSSRNVTVPRGVPVQVSIDFSESSDPDGWTTPTKGMSVGGSCSISNFNGYQGVSSRFTVRRISNPATPAACNTTIGSVTFNGPIGSNTYLFGGLVDASSAGSSERNAMVTVTIVSPTANSSPVAVVKAGINGSSPTSSSINVRQGVPFTLSLDASQSFDPDVWTTVGKGVSAGGKCEWNTDLNRGTPTFERTISNPATPAGCNTNVGPITVNLAPGTYTVTALRITDASGAQSTLGGTANLSINVSASAPNQAPIARVSVSVNGGPLSSSIAVSRGLPVRLTASAAASTDPDGWLAPGIGVSAGGKCEWNADMNQGAATFEQVIANPLSSGACNFNLGTKTFNDIPGIYVYNLLRITDAAGGVSSIGSITVRVADTGPTPTPASGAPIAVARFIVNGGAPSENVTVTRGVPVQISLDASGSSDPDGWTTPGRGVANGGKCEWNTNLDQSRPASFRRAIRNPATPSACNVDLGTLTFNDAPGRYRYTLLRITDASGAQSVVSKLDKKTDGLLSRIFPGIATAYAQSSSGSGTITVVDPTPTPTPTPTGGGFPDDPGPLVTCGPNTKVSFYYEKANAVRNGIVPFRILLNSRNFGRVPNNPRLIEAYQLIKNSDGSVTKVPVSDASLQYTPPDVRTYIDGNIYMQSADGVVLQFELWCSGFQGYDYLELVKTYTWTIPDLPTPSISPTPSLSPSPTITPCAFWDIFCSTPTPTPSPCPEGVACITPDPTITPCAFWDVFCTTPSPTPCPEGEECEVTPTPIVDYNPWDDVPPEPTEIGDAVISSICEALGCDKQQVIKFIQGINPVVATAAVAIGVAASVPAIALNILPQLSHFFQAFGAFFSLHRRKTRWGIVVDSDLGRPISRAIVQVFDAKFHQLKETQITGSDGQFGFLLPPGNYYLVVSESGFVFPARKKPPTVLQENERIYLGEEFESDERDPDKVPHLVVPLDREEKTPVAQMLFWRFAEHALALIDGIGVGFLIVGAAINTFFLLTVPGRLNIVFEVLYLLLFAIKLYILLSHQKGLGSVVDSTTGNPIDLAIVRLYDSQTNRIVQTRVTNVHGRFFVLMPHGTYSAAVAKAGYKTYFMQNVKISGRTSKALALDFKLVPETAEGSGSGAISTPTPLPQPQTPIAPNPVIASK